MIRTLNLQALDYELWNDKILLNALEEENILTFLYTKQFILDEASNKLNKMAEKSIKSYQKLMLNLHIMLFILKTLVVVSAFLVFYFVIYKKMKNTMIDCNTLIKVLPLEYIIKDNLLMEVKKFILS